MKQKLQEEIDKLIIAVGDFSIFLSIVDRTNRENQ